MFESKPKDNKGYLLSPLSLSDTLVHARHTFSMQPCDATLACSFSGIVGQDTLMWRGERREAQLHLEHEKEEEEK